MRGKRLRCWLKKKKWCTFDRDKNIFTTPFPPRSSFHPFIHPGLVFYQPSEKLSPANFPSGRWIYEHENTIQGKHFFVSLFPILILCDFIRCLSNKNNYCNLSRCEKNGEKQFKIYNLRLFRLISNKSSETLAHTSSSSYNSRSTLIRNYFQYYPSVSGYQNIIQIVSQRN